MIYLGQVACTKFSHEIPFLLFTLIRSAQIGAYFLVGLFLYFVPILVLKRPVTYLQGIQAILVTVGVSLFQISRGTSKESSSSLDWLPVILSFSGLLVESFGLIYRQNTQTKYKSDGVEILFTTSLFTLVPSVLHSKLFLT